MEILKDKLYVEMCSKVQNDLEEFRGQFNVKQIFNGDWIPDLGQLIEIIPEEITWNITTYGLRMNLDIHWTFESFYWNDNINGWHKWISTMNIFWLLVFMLAKKNKFWDNNISNWESVEKSMKDERS